MKKLQPSLILLPCHSLDDFPVYHKGDDAASLLASWTALWHPLLLVASQALPSWNRIDDPPEECCDRFMVTPQVGYSDLPTGFSDRVKEQGGRLVKGTSNRSEIIERGLEFVAAANPVPETWVPDFLALGYAYLQVQLLTRHMRYASNLDLIHFGNQVLAAAQAALDGDDGRTQELLQRCFDILTEEREHFYPVDALLMDTVLLPPQVDAPALQRQLDAEHCINVLAPGESLQAWAGDPSIGDSIRQAVTQERWSLIGGELIEARTSLLSQESVLSNIQQGGRVFEESVGRRPRIFGRRRFGLSWAYPQILKASGFVGAIHATLDDGRFPEGLHLKTTWEGRDEASIDTFARIPFDASLPETYLTLAIKIGEMLDSDHSAGMCLVHWPGTPCPWYEDLIRVNRYCGALGKFVSFETFFKEINDSGIADRFQPDQYRSPYLQQAIITKQTDPISAQIRYWQDNYRATAAGGLNLLGDVVQGTVSATEDWHARVLRLDESPNEATRDELTKAIDARAIRFGQALAGKGDKGWLIVNPFGTVRRAGVRLPASVPIPKADRPIYAADRAGDSTFVVVDVPAMGYVWLPASGKDGAIKSGPALGDDYLLRNEFFETTIDRHTGGLRTFHEYNIRGNRLSQQLAMRLPSDQPEQGHQYTLMQADKIETKLANMACAEIVSQGRLVHPNSERVAAEFEQTFRVWRGIRILEMEIEIRPQEALRSDPWNSYFCQRLVWREQAADIYRDVNQVRWIGGNKRLEAPQFIELEMEPRLTTLFTGGLPFHRRQELNYMDTLLQVRGESASSFRLGLGLDVPNPVAAAAVFGSSLSVVPDVPCPANGPNGWLFHIDARSVIATHWESLGDEGQPPIGFKVRLLETMGRPVKAKIAAVQEPVSARKLDFVGGEIETCDVVESRVEVMMNANELTEVEVRWDR